MLKGKQSRIFLRVFIGLFLLLILIGDSVDARTPPGGNALPKPDYLTISLPWQPNVPGDLRWYNYGGATHISKDDYAIDFNLNGATIYPARQGKVTFIGRWDGTTDGYGNYVLIAHTNSLPNTNTYVSIYAHLKRIDEDLVLDQDVQTNTPLGVEGSSGDAHKPPIRHLHFALWYCSGVSLGVFPSDCRAVVPEPILGQEVYEGFDWWRTLNRDIPLIAERRPTNDDVTPNGAWSASATSNGEQISRNNPIRFHVNYYFVKADLMGGGDVVSCLPKRRQRWPRSTSSP